MNSINNENNLITAQNYYQALLEKDFDRVNSYLHPDIVFIGPLAQLQGKEAVITAAQRLSTVLRDIEIRSKFASENQIMLAYDFIFPKPIGTLRAAVLMEFKNQLISKIELFFDARQFEPKKN